MSCQKSIEIWPGLDHLIFRVVEFRYNIELRLGNRYYTHHDPKLNCEWGKDKLTLLRYNAASIRLFLHLLLQSIRFNFRNKFRQLCAHARTQWSIDLNLSIW